jgi:hypothetical protein
LGGQHAPFWGGHFTPELGGQHQRVFQFDAITYPNPYENYFHVQLNTSSDEQVAIKVYDMLGKKVEEHTVQPSDLEALQLGKDLSNGEYSIVIMQAGDVVRKRLVRRAH